MMVHVAHFERYLYPQRLGLLPVCSRLTVDIYIVNRGLFNFLRLRNSFFTLHDSLFTFAISLAVILVVANNLRDKPVCCSSFGVHLDVIARVIRCAKVCIEGVHALLEC